MKTSSPLRATFRFTTHLPPCFSFGCILVFLLASASTIRAQFPGRLQGGHDKDILTPSQSGRSAGPQDPAALSELAAYRTAVGASSWTGMQATGTVTFDSDPTPFAVTLATTNGNRARMDITTATGHDITVVNGLHGSFAYGAGPTEAMSSAQAAVGIAPFYLFLSDLAESSRGYGVLDRGMVNVEGTSLHRISIEIPLGPRKQHLVESATKSVVDAYFDPATHLLVKTASLIPAPGHPLALLLRVNTYNGYKSFGSHQLPTLMAETINGQTVWTMALTSIDADTPPSHTLFNF